MGHFGKLQKCAYNSQSMPCTDTIAPYQKILIFRKNGAFGRKLPQTPAKPVFANIC